MGRRAVGLFLICGAIVSLAIVSTAWACGRLATLSASDNTVTPNQTISVTGQNYSTSATSSQVRIRWNSRKGTVLETTPVNPDSTISAQVTIPGGAKTGSALLIGEQTTASGNPCSGCPGRTTVEVSAPVASRKKEAPVGGIWGSSKPHGGTGATVTVVDAAPSGPGLIAAVLGIGASVALLGSGMTLVRRSRSAKPAHGV